MYLRLLHPTDLSRDHFNMCQEAAKLAKCFNAKLFLLHVIEPPPTLQLAQGLGFAEFDLPTPVRNDAIAVMAALGEALNIPIEQQFVEIGSIKTHTLTKVIELDCQLIILGHNTPTKLPAFLGGTAHSILQEAPCDVLTLRR